MVVQGCVLDAFLHRSSFACVTAEYCATASSSLLKLFITKLLVTDIHCY